MRCASFFVVRVRATFVYRILPATPLREALVEAQHAAPQTSQADRSAAPPASTAGPSPRAPRPTKLMPARAGCAPAASRASTDAAAPACAAGAHPALAGINFVGRG